MTNKKSLFAAALLGLVLVLPAEGWSQTVRQTRSQEAPALVASARYDYGQQLEREGRMAAALEAYLEAAVGGHGPAQKRLGDIYGTGKGDVQRDYETSLRWYKRARDQGEEIPLPFTYPGVRR